MSMRVSSEATKKRILIVEDEGIIARDLAAMLEQLGYEVVGQAGTYEQALEVVSLLPPDLVLMDIKIRGRRDGVEAAEEIRRTVGLPVVFVTAHADSNTLKRANETQPFGYVVKPFNESTLKVAIELGLNRHRLQEQSDTKQTWLRYALEGISEAVIATDPDGNITLLNPGAEQLTGWSLDEATGRPLGEVLHLQHQDVELDLIALGDNSTTKEPLSFPNVKVRHKQGEECQAMASFGPVHRLGGHRKHGYVALMRAAITPAREKSSDKQLEELAYALSNDLREPVRNVSCFASLLERSGKGHLDEASLEYLQFIVEGSKRIESQMSALRSFHLAGSMQFDPRVCADITEICHEVLNKLATQLAEINAQIELGPMPAVAIDHDGLREVVRHLISNAIQFRAERPLRIQISATRTGQSWTVCFRDNGRGFEREQGTRIFSLFTRAHPMPPSGNGIGLAICRRVIESAGGRIWAESQAGAGADFFVRLPALTRTEPEAA